MGPVISYAQIETWLGTAFFPFVRIAACLMVAPVFGERYVPVRLRVGLAGALTLIVLPLIPAAQGVRLLSLDGVLTVFQQVLIGAVLGFVLHLMFDAITLGGQLLANSMGLEIAFNLDPLRGSPTPALGQFYTLLATLIFLALNGHIALIRILVDSFRGLPIGTAGLSARALHALANWGDQLFSGALRVALPGMTALLVINLALGVMSRAAPSLNLFAVGFPLSLLLGLLVCLLALPSVQSAFVALMGSTLQFLQALSAGH